MRRLLSGLILTAAATPAAAANMALTIEIPRLTVAEYHKPYVAAWLEKADQSAGPTLALWYEQGKGRDKGLEYLKDVRQWWRRTGRELSPPFDGVSGATRAPGLQTISLSSASGPLAKLAPGQYTLNVEVAREVGGRELVKIPFQWPPKAPQTGQAKGASEIGAVTLSLKP
jgi:hypothetical protein